MITKFFAQKVSVTHNLNNPTRGTLYEGENKVAENQRIGEARQSIG